MYFAFPPEIVQYFSVFQFVICCNTIGHVFLSLSLISFPKISQSIACPRAILLSLITLKVLSYHYVHELSRFTQNSGLALITYVYLYSQTQLRWLMYAKEGQNVFKKDKRC